MSEELSTAYGALERQVEGLTVELAAANARRSVCGSRPRRNARLAAMGEMAAQLAHQLRTPLAAALLYAGNLENPELPKAMRISIAQKTVGRLKHLERLIQDMLLSRVAKCSGAKTSPANELFGELSAYTFEPLARVRGIEFALASAPGGLAITGNRKALAGALTNLLENAFQAVAQNTPGRPKCFLAPWGGTERSEVFGGRGGCNGGTGGKVSLGVGWWVTTAWLSLSATTAWLRHGA